MPMTNQNSGLAAAQAPPSSSFSRLLQPTISSAQRQRERPATALNKSAVKPSQTMTSRRKNESDLSTINMFDGNLSTIGVKNPQQPRRTRQERREEQQEKLDQVRVLCESPIAKRSGHKYEWQNAEEEKFRTQSIDRFKRIDQETGEDRDRMRRKGRDMGAQMSKIINTQNAKSVQKTHVDRDALRRHTFGQLQNEIRQEGVIRDKNGSSASFGMQSRQSEVERNRIKNRFSSLSMLAGGQTAKARLNSSLNHSVTQKEIATVQESFGDQKKQTVYRPIM